jgi:hypothetical protein
MSDLIVNRVSNSPLQVIDLEDIYQEGTRTLIKITDFLENGTLLREKPFRKLLKEHNWDVYQDHYVAVYCNDSVLVPQWATLLIVAHLKSFAARVVVGKLSDLEKLLYVEKLTVLDLSSYENGIVMIKGCSNKPVPELALGLLAEKLTTIVKKLSYGEACSSVPLYKKL